MTDLAEPTQTLQVWCVADQRPGHRNQLIGLVERLSVYAQVTAVWLDCDRLPTTWLDSLWPIHDPAPGAVPPDLVLGVGHDTHRHLLAIKRRFGCRACVLMRPSLPVACFDMAIIPKHDKPAQSPRVLATDGVINKIGPSTLAPEQRQLGLILIGGESRHFHWDSAAVLAQVIDLVRSDAERRWVLTDSRRTPEDFWAALAAALPDNLTIHRHSETASDWLVTHMAESALIAVTPDSVSMVYEALTSGATTAIFALQPKGEGRILRGIQTLLASGRLEQLAPSCKLRADQQTQPLWEADRAAQWLLGQLRESV